MVTFAIRCHKDLKWQSIDIPVNTKVVPDLQVFLPSRPNNNGANLPLQRPLPLDPVWCSTFGGIMQHMGLRSLPAWPTRLWFVLDPDLTRLPVLPIGFDLSTIWTDRQMVLGAWHIFGRRLWSQCGSGNNIFIS